MVYLHLANGFEEIEAVTVADILRRGGVTVQLVSMESTLDVTGSHKITVKADILFREADYKTCELMVFPGGMPGTNGGRPMQTQAQSQRNFATASAARFAACPASYTASAAYPRKFR